MKKFNYKNCIREIVKRIVEPKMFNDYYIAQNTGLEIAIQIIKDNIVEQKDREKRNEKI